MSIVAEELASSFIVSVISAIMALFVAAYKEATAYEHRSKATLHMRWCAIYISTTAQAQFNLDSINQFHVARVQQVIPHHISIGSR